MRASGDISAFIDAHGDDAVQRVLDHRRKKRGRPIGAAKWDSFALMRLWVTVQFEAYVWRRLHSRPNARQQAKIYSAIEAAFSTNRRRIAFLEGINPVSKDILTLTRGSVARRFYEADNLMQEWKRDGDKRYAIYIDTLSKVVQAFERD